MKNLDCHIEFSLKKVGIFIVMKNNRKSNVEVISN